MVVSANLDHDFLARKAKSHWKTHRPKMYNALVKSGQLENTLRSVVERAQEQYMANAQSGMACTKQKTRRRGITCSCLMRTTCLCWARIPTHYQFLPA
jgi:hypothetical protein